MITIFMPVSRSDYLINIFNRLELLECDRQATNLLVICDNDKIYPQVRNLVADSKFNDRLCVKSGYKLASRYSVEQRRLRIAALKNLSKELIKSCDYIFSLEDDTLIPSDALKKLLKGYQQYPHAGFIQGIELGRWGIPYAGAWMVDDIYNPTELITSERQNGLQPTDAGGFYCYLTKYEHYQHDYQPFDNNALGPDVEYGISLRQQGLYNYTDWSITCAHYSNRQSEAITLNNSDIKQIEMVKTDKGWRQEVLK